MTEIRSVMGRAKPATSPPRQEPIPDGMNETAEVSFYVYSNLSEHTSAKSCSTIRLDWIRPLPGPITFSGSH